MEAENTKKKLPYTIIKVYHYVLYSKAIRWDKINIFLLNHPYIIVKFIKLFQVCHYNSGYHELCR